jgi:hypothetical protein
MMLSNEQTSFLSALNLHQAGPSTFTAWVLPEDGIDGYSMNLRYGTLSSAGILRQMTGVKVYEDRGTWFIMHYYNVQGRSVQKAKECKSAKDAFGQAREWIRKCESHGSKFVPVR